MSKPPYDRLVSCTERVQNIICLLQALSNAANTASDDPNLGFNISALADEIIKAVKEVSGELEELSASWNKNFELIIAKFEHVQSDLYRYTRHGDDVGEQLP